MASRASSVSRRAFVSAGAVAVLSTRVGVAEGIFGSEPLPSWNNGPAKQAILTFVRETTEKSSAKYVEPADRIATFDQDGTLWTEHPLYGQAAFALARVGEMAHSHPEWKTKEPFMTVLSRNYGAMAKF